MEISPASRINEAELARRYSMERVNKLSTRIILEIEVYRIFIKPTPF